VRAVAGVVEGGRAPENLGWKAARGVGLLGDWRWKDWEPGAWRWREGAVAAYIPLVVW
jgi:hypothetical protein